MDAIRDLIYFFSSLGPNWLSLLYIPLYILVKEIEEENYDWLVNTSPLKIVGLVKSNFDKFSLGNLGQLSIKSIIRDHLGTILRAYSRSAGVRSSIET